MKLVDQIAKNNNVTMYGLAKLIGIHPKNGYHIRITGPYSRNICELFRVSKMSAEEFMARLSEEVVAKPPYKPVPQAVSSDKLANP